jgi:type II secretory pathway pseudopilin PulG
VVIAIIGLLAGMLLPALNEARTKAKVAKEESFLLQVSLATEMYEQDYRRYLWTYRNGLNYRFEPNSLFKTMNIRPDKWQDPFRETPISASVLGSSIGYQDADAPPNGQGRAFLNLVDKTGTSYHIGGLTQPATFLNTVYSNLKLPTNAVYAIVSAGPDGIIDMDAKGDDIIFVRDESDAKAHRHRP